MRDRLDQLRSFIWWTAPLYVLLAVLGLVETHFTLTLALAVLFALLAAFGLFDGVVLVSVGSLRARAVGGPADLAVLRGRLERLSRTVVLVGGALAAAAVLALAAVWIAAS